MLYYNGYDIVDIDSVPKSTIVEKMFEEPEFEDPFETKEKPSHERLK